MRNKLVPALILLGAVTITTASMPQKVRPLSQKFNVPVCNCIVEEGGKNYFGVLDGDDCVIGNCILPDE